jgi:alpha-L-rhamnosidase
MITWRRILLNILWTGFVSSVFSQIVWQAAWITHPEESESGFGVYHFRKTFQLESVPSTAIARVSADNRYRLFVNGRVVCFGPQRGDVEHWRYESVDFAPHLNAGENVIAVQVHNAGPDFPMAQVTDRTGFILQSEDLGLFTDASWKVLHNPAYNPITMEALKWWEWAGGWYACGFTDELDAARYPWGWEQPEFDDTDWTAAKTVTGAWKLEARRIPFLEEKRERFSTIRRTSGICVSDDFLDGHSPVTIPAHSEVSLLLDMRRESVGFPELRLSGGRGADIKITYAETLFDDSKEKGDRNAVDGKIIRGYWDIYHADGGDNRLFRPLWLRTFRYVQMDITTRSDALILDDYYQVFTTYPLQLRASFECDNPALKPIWDTAWRTMRCCALETYTDCPYYEQLNYPGDTRLQACCSLYLSGDDRLMRDAVRLMSYSKMSNGLTQAAYPIHQGKAIKIPTYALFWISMLHDYFMLRGDDAFIRPYLPVMRDILDWFDAHIDDSGLLYALEMWNFVDWSFPEGTPEGAKKEEKEHSGFVSLQYAYTLDQAADLVSHFGNTDEAAGYRRKADTLKHAVMLHCFNGMNGLFADSPQKEHYSQHTNIFAVLTNTISENEQSDLIQRILDDQDLIQCTSYFSYYLFKAMQKVGKADLFLDHLGLWHQMLKQGHTTFGETGGDHDRSDCHAWSAHPAYFFLSLVCGILPGAPGFNAVIIQPALGRLNEIKGAMPHPQGDIIVHLKRLQKDGVKGEIELPGDLTGVFKWKENSISLESGVNLILEPGNSIETDSIIPGEINRDKMIQKHSD